MGNKTPSFRYDVMVMESGRSANRVSRQRQKLRISSVNGKVGEENAWNQVVAALSSFVYQKHSVTI